LDSNPDSHVTHYKNGIPTVDEDVMARLRPVLPMVGPGIEILPSPPVDVI